MSQATSRRVVIFDTSRVKSGCSHLDQKGSYIVYDFPSLHFLYVPAIHFSVKSQVIFRRDPSSLLRYRLRQSHMSFLAG